MSKSNWNSIHRISSYIWLRLPVTGASFHIPGKGCRCQTVTSKLLHSRLVSVPLRSWRSLAREKCLTSISRVEPQWNFSLFISNIACSQLEKSSPVSSILKYWGGKYDLECRWLNSAQCFRFNKMSPLNLTFLSLHLPCVFSLCQYDGAQHWVNILYWYYVNYVVLHAEKKHASKLLATCTFNTTNSGATNTAFVKLLSETKVL